MSLCMLNYEKKNYEVLRLKLKILKKRKWKTNEGPFPPKISLSLHYGRWFLVIGKRLNMYKRHPWSVVVPQIVWVRFILLYIVQYFFCSKHDWYLKCTVLLYLIFFPLTGFLRLSFKPCIILVRLLSCIAPLLPTTAIFFNRCYISLSLRLFTA